MTSSSLRHILKIAFACGLALWFQTAAAVPVSIGGVTTGFRGDPVSPTLFDDSVTEFEAAEITLTFDPVFLTFTGAAAGTLTSGFSVVPGAPAPAGSLMEVLISMSTGGSPVTGGPGSVLIALFLINNAAPLGTTSVVFEDNLPEESGFYHFPTTPAEITVLDNGVPAPIGNTGVLMLAGLAALSAFRRRTVERQF